MGIEQRHPSEEERQYALLWKGETIDEDYLVGLNPNYGYLIGQLIDAGVVKQITLNADGEEVHLLQLYDRENTPQE